jgi:hypothetical protein
VYILHYLEIKNCLKVHGMFVYLALSYLSRKAKIRYAPPPLRCIEYFLVLMNSQGTSAMGGGGDCALSGSGGIPYKIHLF